MTLKDKVKTYSFWISLVSAVLIIVRVVGEHFGWFINESFIMDIVTGVCGVLVLLGILSSPTQNTTSETKNMENTITDLQSKTDEIVEEQAIMQDQIKQDIETKQLSIAEQIELLKAQIYKLSKEKEETEEKQFVNSDFAEQAGEETEDVEEPCDVDAFEDVVNAEENEQTLCGEQIAINEDCIKFEQNESEEMEQVAAAKFEGICETVAAENCAEKTIINVQEKAQTMAETEALCEKKENNMDIDVSALSTAQIKELLIQLLNRL